jgi:hypothetical protein
MKEALPKRFLDDSRQKRKFFQFGPCRDMERPVHHWFTDFFLESLPKLRPGEDLIYGKPETAGYGGASG